MSQSRAVFLSYASEDVDTAERIRIALTAAGIEVWFDKNELRGGDTWDQKIHQQIKECQLFIPIISANTQNRKVGYFRREWNQAVDHLQDFDPSTPFLVPVVLDQVPQNKALVPHKFREHQWEHLPRESVPDRFVQHVRNLRDVAESNTITTMRRVTTPTDGARRGDWDHGQTHSPATTTDRAATRIRLPKLTLWRAVAIGVGVVAAAAVTTRIATGYWHRSPPPPTPTNNDAARGQDVPPEPASFTEKHLALAYQAHDGSSEHNERRAIQEFELVINADAGNVSAYLGKAEAIYRLASLAGGGEKTARTQALELVEKTIQTAPSGPGYASRAALELRSWNWQSAQSSIRKAIELDGQYRSSLTRRINSDVLASFGRRDDALNEARTAVDLAAAKSPGPYVFGALALALRATHRSAEAEQTLRPIQQKDPDSEYVNELLLGALIDEGKLDEAAAARDRLADDALRMSGTAVIEALLHHGAQSDAAIGSLVAEYGDRRPYVVASTYAGLGRADEALGWLGRALEAGPGADPMYRLQSDTCWDALHGNAGYELIIKKMKFPKPDVASTARTPESLEHGVRVARKPGGTR